MGELDTKKLVLRTVVKLMVMVALGAFLWVLFGSIPEKDRQVIETTRFNVADMRPGEHLLVEWQKKPLYIVYRKPEWEAALLSANDKLLHDPDSARSTQPTAATNALRSSVPGWFVTLGLGTGMGCTLLFSEPDETDLAVDGVRDAGGFVDGCDRSRYDLAGRVYVDQQARRNTVVPNWSLVDGEILVGG